MLCGSSGNPPVKAISWSTYVLKAEAIQLSGVRPDLELGLSRYATFFALVTVISRRWFRALNAASSWSSCVPCLRFTKRST